VIDKSIASSNLSLLRSLRRILLSARAIFYMHMHGIKGAEKIGKLISAQRLQSDGCEPYAKIRCCLSKFSGPETEGMLEIECKYISLRLRHEVSLNIICVKLITVYGYYHIPYTALATIYYTLLCDAHSSSTIHIPSHVIKIDII